jgi:outer membrane protein, heavy metal efflux system
MRGWQEGKGQARRLRPARSAWLVVPLALLVSRKPAWSQVEPQRTVTLPEALALLQTQNPDTRAAALRVAEAEAERLTARLYPNPQLSYDVTDIPVGHTTPAGLSVGQTIGNTVRIDQPLILWGKRRLRIAGAQVGVMSAQDQERDVHRQLRLAAKDGFYDVLHDQRVLAFALDNRNRYRKIVDLNQRRFKSGDISEADFRKVQLEQLKYESQVEDARRGLSESEQLLGRLLGIGDAVAATGRLAPPALDVGTQDLLQLALQNRPDYAALQQEKERAEIALSLAKRERYPDVTVGADYTHSEFVVSGDNRNTIGFGFSVPLPLLNQNQGEIAKAEVAVRQAETELARLRLDLTQEVHNAVEAYRSTQRLRQTFESGYLDRAKMTVDAAETSYRVGAASLIELLDAERTYTETQNDYFDTVAAARMSLDALDKAVGKDLEGE